MKIRNGFMKVVDNFFDFNKVSFLLFLGFLLDFVIVIIMDRKVFK